MRKIVADYQTGLLDSHKLKAKITSQLLKDLEFLPAPLKVLPVEKTTFCFDLEHCEDRYLLTGHDKGEINIVDLQVPPNDNIEGPKIVGSTAACGLKKNTVSGVKWTPGDYRLFSSTISSELKLWDTNQVRMIFSKNVKGHINTHAHSLSSTALIAVAAQNGASIVDVRTGNASSSLTFKKLPILGLSWSPSSEYTLAVSTHAGSVFLWDRRSSAAPVKVIHRNTPITGICFNRDGTCLATKCLSEAKRLKVINLANKATVFSDDLVTEGSRVRFSPIYYHFGFLFVSAIESGIFIIGGSPLQKYYFEVPGGIHWHAFRPTCYELILSDLHGRLFQYKMHQTEIPEQLSCDNNYSGINYDEFSY